MPLEAVLEDGAEEVEVSGVGKAAEEVEVARAAEEVKIAGAIPASAQPCSTTLKARIERPGGAKGKGKVCSAAVVMCFV